MSATIGFVSFMYITNSVCVYWPTFSTMYILSRLPIKWT